MAKGETKTGRELEQRVANAYRAMGALVQHDMELAGNQIDVYVELSVGGSPYRIVVEAKDHARAVGVKIVNDFAQIVSLLRRENLIDRGIIVSARGFTKQARSAARTYCIELLEPADLKAMVGEAEEEGETSPADISGREAETDVYQPPERLPLDEEEIIGMSCESRSVDTHDIPQKPHLTLIKIVSALLFLVTVVSMSTGSAIEYDPIFGAVAGAVFGGIVGIVLAAIILVVDWIIQRRKRMKMALRAVFWIPVIIVGCLFVSLSVDTRKSLGEAFLVVPVAIFLAAIAGAIFVISVWVTDWIICKVRESSQNP